MHVHVKTPAQVHFSSPQPPASSNGSAFGVENGSGSREHKQQAPARRHSLSALAGDVFDGLLDQVLHDDSHEVSVGGIIFSSIKEFMDDASRSRGSSVREQPASAAPDTKSADETDRSGAPASGEPAPTAQTQVCSNSSISTIFVYIYTRMLTSTSIQYVLSEKSCSPVLLM